MPHYRCSFPDRYSVNTPGFSNPGDRQGYYTNAPGPSEAADAIRKENANHPKESIDVQDWNKDGEYLGKVVLTLRNC